MKKVKKKKIKLFFIPVQSSKIKCTANAVAGENEKNGVNRFAACVESICVLVTEIVFALFSSFAAQLNAKTSAFSYYSIGNIMFYVEKKKKKHKKKANERIRNPFQLLIHKPIKVCYVKLLEKFDVITIECVLNISKCYNTTKRKSLRNILNSHIC